MIKADERLVGKGRLTIFQMAAAAMPKEVSAGILGLINTLRCLPAAAPPT
ncbi:MAG: hypothetical protein ACE368_15510 [Paracoccaceae bacterium]